MSFERRMTAGWLDLAALLAGLDVLPKTSDCQMLPTSLK